MVMYFSFLRKLKHELHAVTMQEKFTQILFSLLPSDSITCAPSQAQHPRIKLVCQLEVLLSTLLKYMHNYDE